MKDEKHTQLVTHPMSGPLLNHFLLLEDKEEDATELYMVRKKNRAQLSATNLAQPERFPIE
jgi:hypothetical protein